MKTLWMFLVVAGIGLMMGCDSGPTTTSTPDPSLESTEYEKEMDSVTEPAPE